jgi:hypothetical protein
VHLGIIFAIVIALVLWVVVSYNRLVGLRNQAANGWCQIDVQRNYPALKPNENVRLLQEEQSATENTVGFARQFYNDTATRFNTAQQVFPTNIFANMVGVKRSELFEITEAREREVPVVDLSRRV